MRYDSRPENVPQAMTAPAPPQPHQPLKRSEGIDVLRGLSIWLVVLHHLGIRIPLKKTAAALFLPTWLTHAINYNGYDAVFIFFVISGFLIATNSMKRWDRLGSIKLESFYRQRAARILPLLFVLLAVLSLLQWTGLPDYAISRPDQSLAGALGSALGLFLNWYEGHTGYLPANWDVLWSLSIEEAFYLGFPLLCMMIRNEAVLGIVLALLAISLPETRAALSGNAIWQEKAYLPGMAGIATGVVAALVANRFHPPRKAALALLLGLGIVGLGADLFAGSILWPVLHDGVVLLLTSSVACLVLAMQWLDREGAGYHLPGTAWIRKSGQLSYEIYLTHMFVVLPLVQAFLASGGDFTLGWICYVPVIPLCWLLGTLVAKGISGPAAKFLLHGAKRAGVAARSSRLA